MARFWTSVAACTAQGHGTWACLHTRHTNHVWKPVMRVHPQRRHVGRSREHQDRRKHVHGLAWRPPYHVAPADAAVPEPPHPHERYQGQHHRKRPAAAAASTTHAAMSAAASSRARCAVVGVVGVVADPPPNSSAQQHAQVDGVGEQRRDEKPTQGLDGSEPRDAKEVGRQHWHAHVLLVGLRTTQRAPLLHA